MNLEKNEAENCILNEQQGIGNIKSIKNNKWAKIFFVAFVCLFSIVWANCPVSTQATVADKKGFSSKFPYQFELVEFRKQAKCQLSFSQNPAIKSLNSQIRGNPKKLPSVNKRLPSEPLVVMPYDEIGQYGGTLEGISGATESGTSDLLSVRHVNLVRYSDNLKDIVPNVAKSWKWNKQFTQITFTLRKGHKWSDGKPFTASDIVFWYNNIMMDKNVVEKPKERFLSNGKKWKVEAISKTKVRITLGVAKPGLLAQFATDYAQPFLPKHFLGRFHPKINKNANKLARKLGFKNGYEIIKIYFGGSNWKDVPTPLLKIPNKVNKLPKATLPTLESHIVVEDTSDGRKLVANPYFHMVDTKGQQLPYIDKISEIYIADEQVRTLKMINGEVSYKQQAVNPNQAPLLLEKQRSGNYTVDMVPTVGRNVVVSFNLTDKDLNKRKVFNKLKFRQAMSLAIDRAEIIDSVYFGKGRPEQYTVWDPRTVDFISDKMLSSYTKYDQVKAKHLLDSIGVKDKNGDGFRDTPNGKPLILNIQFSSQGTPVGLVEVVANNWKAVGVSADIKEVTSEEYRSAQSANELSVHIWYKVKPGAILAYNPNTITPPFGDYFDHRNAILWGNWIDSKGKSGVKPPKKVFKAMKLMQQFQIQKTGSKKQAQIGAKIAKIFADELWFIGTVGNQQSPVYHNNKLGNFKTMTAKSYDYYQMYPYRPNQYFIKN